MRNESYGIVFSGGGALGAWEAGCYDAIRARHQGMPPLVVTGASAGALNAVGVCAGMPPAQLASLWAGIRPEDVYRFRFSKWDAVKILAGAPRAGLYGSLLNFLSRDHIKSIHDTEPLKATLRKTFERYFNDFMQSPIYFAISLTNLTKRKPEFFYKVPVGSHLPDCASQSHVSWEPVKSLDQLLQALEGSTALPILFPPTVETYFDGGVLLNQPIVAATTLIERVMHFPPKQPPAPA